MIHKPIQLQDISLIYPHKTCFEAFSSRINVGDRIAIIGRNGVGKSTLLKMLQDATTPVDGEIKRPSDISAGYLPQIIDDFPKLSGGKRLNQLLTTLLAANPNLLLLDEPTNNLDRRNRRSLICMLQHYPGTLVIVSHDVELIAATTDMLWYIEAQSIRVFSGCYRDCQQNLRQKKEWIEQALENLSKQKKEAHLRLMKEQARNKQLHLRGEKHIAQRKWSTIRSHAKLASSVKTGDKRLAQINEIRHQLKVQQSMLSQPETIKPKFKLQENEHHNPLITIQDASVSYSNGSPILQDLNFYMAEKARVAIDGDNDSEKSTLIKAVLNESSLKKTGHWMCPPELMSVISINTINTLLWIKL